MGNLIMKKYLIVYYGDAPECVEKFKKDCVRSCKGALHINPGRQLTVTEDEYKHIKKCYAHIMPKLRVLSEMKPEAKKEAIAEPKKADVEPAQEEGIKKKKKNRN